MILSANGKCRGVIFRAGQSRLVHIPYLRAAAGCNNEPNRKDGQISPSEMFQRDLNARHIAFPKSKGPLFLVNHNENSDQFSLKQGIIRRQAIAASNNRLYLTSSESAA